MRNKQIGFSWISGIQMKQNFSFKFLLVLFSILSFSGCQGQTETDERCFLQTGGSTASFFVKEDLKVGSLVGQMR